MEHLHKFTEAIDFAAKKHRFQRRKGPNDEPYINHPIEVMKFLSTVGEIEDLDVLIAAVLHDTVEDTNTTKEEITEKFGSRVCGFVMEVTDDNNLPKAARKQAQIDKASQLSAGARLIKLADKISNIEDIRDNPPVGWSVERCQEYLVWSEKVVARIRGANKNLEEYFDQIVISTGNSLEKRIE
ncbi:MAG: HD domain-containing protein [Pyrinomonadaceae bacterium]